MVSVKAYAAVITRFLDSYQEVLSKAMINDISTLYEWVRNYQITMASQRVKINGSAEENMRVANEQLDYVKRGANLLRNFVIRYEKESERIADKLYKCRMVLLRGASAPLKKECQDKDKLIEMQPDLKRFASDIIGCADTGNDFFLSILKKIAHVLGDDYVKIKNDIELTCIRLRIEILRAK